MFKPGQIWRANTRGHRNPVCVIAPTENLDTVVIAPLGWKPEPLAVQLPKRDCREGEPTYVCCSLITALHRNSLEVQTWSLEQETLNRIRTAVAELIGIALAREDSLSPCQAEPHRGDLWSIDLQPHSEGRTVGLIVSSDIYQKTVESDFLALSVVRGEKQDSEFDVFIAPELATTSYGVTIECASIATFPRKSLGKKMATLRPEAMQLIDTKLRQLF